MEKPRTIFLRHLVLTPLVFTTLVLFGGLTNIADAANELIPYRAEYIVEKYDSAVARAKYQLENTDGHYSYSLQTRLTGFLALFRKDTLTENSVLDNKLLLQSYSYDQRGDEDAKDRNIKFDVDWNLEENKLTGIATINRADNTYDIELDQSTWDPLSVQLALMSDINEAQQEYSYQVINKGRLKTYIFSKTGDEQLEIGDDIYETIVLQREQGNKLTKFWLGKDYRYIPVQIDRYKNGKLETRAILDSFGILESEYDEDSDD